MCLPAVAALPGLIAGAASSAGAFLTSAAGMATMAGISTGLGLIGQSEIANAQIGAINAQAQQAYRQNQIEEQDQINENLRAARRADANIMVAAGEAGLALGSGSIESLLLNNQMQTSLTVSNIETNTSFKNEEVANGAQRALSQVNRPSLLGAGLQIAMSTANGYLRADALQLQRPAQSKNAANTAAGS